MAIPEGTTARRMEQWAWWLLAGMAAVAAGVGWWPVHRVWGALTAALLVVLALWVLAQIVRGRRRIHLAKALLIPAAAAAVIAGHLTQAAWAERTHALPLRGALDASILLHMAIWATAILLGRNVLTPSRADRWVWPAVGAVLVAVAVVVQRTPRAQPVHTAITLLGFAGAALALLVLLPRGGLAEQSSRETQHAGGPALLREADGGPERDDPFARVSAPRLAFGCLAPIALFALTWGAGADWPAAALLALLPTMVLARSRRAALVLGLLGAVAWGAGMAVGMRQRPEVVAVEAVWFVAILTTAWTWAAAVPKRGNWLRLAALAALAALVGYAWWPALAGGVTPHITWLGAGGEGWRYVPGPAAGAAVLAVTIGWLGLGLVLACLALALAWSVWRAGPDGWLRCAPWAVSAVLATAAMLAGGGIGLPAATILSGLLWGRLAGEGHSAARSAWWLAGAVAGLSGVLGLAPHPGLAEWMTAAHRIDPDALHLVVGFGAALLLAWLLGSRRVWLGVVGLLLAAGLGPAGEWLQAMFSPRGVEWQDVAYHVTGSISAAVCYLLAIGARACETPMDDADLYDGREEY